MRFKLNILVRYNLTESDQLLPYVTVNLISFMPKIERVILTDKVRTTLIPSICLRYLYFKHLPLLLLSYVEN